MKKAVILGGSSGIGLALGKELLNEGYSLLIASRNKEKLDAAKTELNAIKKVEIDTFCCDILDDNSIKELADFTNEWSGGLVDLLVYSIGDIECDDWNKLSIDDQKHVMDVNYWGAVKSTTALYPYIINTKGSILFISSVAGFMGLYGYTGYSPSKHALTGWAECLRMEAAVKRVKIHVAFPGDTTTPMLKKEREMSLPETKAINAGVKEKSPEQVAAKILNGDKRGKYNIYSDNESPLIRIFKAVMPNFFFRKLDKMAKK